MSHTKVYTITNWSCMEQLIVDRDLMCVVTTDGLAIYESSLSEDEWSFYLLKGVKRKEVLPSIMFEARPISKIIHELKIAKIINEVFADDFRRGRL